MTSKKIAAFFEPNKTSSGQRFFAALCRELAPHTVDYNDNPDIVLFNISAPIQEIIKTKLKGRKVILRVDGVWCDRISPAFLEIFPQPLRLFLQNAAKIKPLKNAVTEFANFVNENYTAFTRILFADHLIYQSRFSKKVHQRYFPKKPFSVILNGAYFRDDITPIAANDNVIRLFVIYSDAPAKGIYESVQFVRWLNEKKNIPAELHLFGFNGKIPKHAPAEMLDRITHSNYVITYPPFQSFSREADPIFAKMHCYICFSHRDSCPNAVVESMAYGLPVLGITSGGVAEIVGDSGELLEWDDWRDGFFAPFRHEHVIKTIDFETLLSLLMKLVGNLEEYRKKVRQRFANELDVKICADKYLQALKKVAETQ
jgi:glycosyltransferase involved in cell wall biosynthesis